MNEVRPTNELSVVAAEFERFLRTDEAVWFMPRQLPDELALAHLPPDQRFGVDLGGATYAGIYGVIPLTLSLPYAERARPVTAAGLTDVGVHPDRRRRGVLTAMLRDHFARVHADPGRHVSVLHASEPGIYGRHGYGLASQDVEITLSQGTRFEAPYLEELTARVETELVAMAGAADRLRGLHERRSLETPGVVVPFDAYYRRWCHERTAEARDKEPRHVLFARLDGTDLGCAVLRRTHRWEDSRAAGEAEVSHLTGSPAAMLALVRRLVDLDLIAHTRLASVGPDEPLLHWGSGPRAWSRVSPRDALWVRLVDLVPALEQRWYAAPCDLVVEVIDEAAPWNAGRWRLRVEDGAGIVRATDAPADLRLPIAALGAGYLGQVGLTSLARAGLVEELATGAAVALDRAMRGPVGTAAPVMF